MRESRTLQHIRRLLPSPSGVLLVLAVTLLPWFSATPVAGAQEAAPTDTDTASTSQKAEPSANEPSVNEPSARKSPGGTEVFVPTEEISEDYAVSFPVDI